MFLKFDVFELSLFAIYNSASLGCICQILLWYTEITVSCKEINQIINLLHGVMLSSLKRQY